MLILRISRNARTVLLYCTLQVDEYIKGFDPNMARFESEIKDRAIDAKKKEEEVKRKCSEIYFIMIPLYLTISLCVFQVNVTRIETVKFS